MVHRNFESTEDMVNNLLDMTAQLDQLEHMLASDSREIVGPAPNLLVIHFQLNQLERFRNQTMHQAKKASAHSQTNLARWFARLDKVITNFDEYIVQLAQNVLNLVRAGDSDVVVKLLKIADMEGKEDEKVRSSCIKNPSAISNFKTLGSQWPCDSLRKQQSSMLRSSLNHCKQTPVYSSTIVPKSSKPSYNPFIVKLKTHISAPKMMQCLF